MTNRGELVLELEERLKKYLDVANIIVTTNGTLPLQIALKVFDITGEVITTPFSYVATTAAIVWEHCQPVFVDINPNYLTIDETKIEAAITSETQAILATHVYGNPCNVEAIEAIANRHGLKVIYDAAHCFGVTYNSKSIFEYGDVSTCSFHATKIFHTGEGGAMFCNSPDLFHRLYYHHNFGHKGELAFHGLGTNAKMSELQAAMGLAILNHMQEILEGRKAVTTIYERLLTSDLKRIQIRPGTSWNYSYYPVIFDSETKLLQAISLLNKAGYFPRRYFYPSLNKLNYVPPQPMPVTEKISKAILCLPLFVGLPEENIEEICSLVNSVIC